MSKLVDWVIARLKEPSTWAALVPVFGAVGWSIDGATLATIGAGIAAFLGIVLKEKPSA
jgi:hypothetical protein